MDKLHVEEIGSPLGVLVAAATGSKLLMVNFKDSPASANEINRFSKELHLEAQYISNPILLELKSQLVEYFSKQRKTFDLPIELIGTDFQKHVWNKLLKIPWGTTVSYESLALQIGNRGSIRAVANANALNKHLIVVPCHRVIGKNGSLTGYSGGLDRKRQLLLLESGISEINF